jgi:hypothetical protein
VLSIATSVIFKDMQSFAESQNEDLKETLVLEYSKHYVYTLVEEWKTKLLPENKYDPSTTNLIISRKRSYNIVSF